MNETTEMSLREFRSTEQTKNEKNATPIIEMKTR